VSGIRRSARGQTLVEFALILPIFIVILVGIFDGGRLVFAYHTVNNAAREGGREATVNQTLGDIQGRAAQHAVALDINPTDVYVDYRQATTPDTESSCDSAVGTPQIFGCLAVVRVTYSYTAATPIIGALIGPIPVTGEVRFPVEFNCVGSIAGNDCPLGN
jgi:Flp pilus assembly protein TadG